MTSTTTPFTSSIVDETISHLEQQFLAPTEIADRGARRGRAVWIADRAAIIAPSDGVELSNPRSRWHTGLPGFPLPGRSR